LCHVVTTRIENTRTANLNLRSTLLAFVGYSLVTLAMTYPIVLNLTTRVPHDLGDPLLSTVILWWNAHHLPFSSGFWDGSFYWPGTGSLTFSDHRLGVSLLAVPLQWMGCSPLTAYNVTLLATFPLCAVSAHWLAYVLTGRHDAATIAGLAYGFNPYRFAHIEHLELLAAFGMPAALAALFLYARERRAKWMVLFTVALFVQALSCSYYFLFFLVFLGLWGLWFLRWRDYRTTLPYLVGVAVLIVVAMMWPIASEYFAVHKRYGLTRGLGDIVTLSADVTSMATASPLSLLWSWTSTLNGPERQLFPGLTIVVLAIAGVLVALRAEHAGRADARRNRAMYVLLGIGLLFAIVAGSAWFIGPWRLPGLSVGTPYKPFSLALLFWIAAAAASPTTRRAYARQSIFAFFVIAAIVLFVFSLGPSPRFLGQQFFYQPPYAWLMRLSVFGDSVRVPARFAMPAILALSSAAALAFARLATSGKSSAIVLTVAATAILADSWVRPLPVVLPPPAWPSSISTDAIAAFVELPLGETLHDAAAMYRTTIADRPTANGYSGYFPEHYEALTVALDELDDSALDFLSSRGPLLVVIDRTWPYAHERMEWLAKHPRARSVGATAETGWFVVDRAPDVFIPRCAPTTIPIVAARDWWGRAPVKPITDGDDDTFWASGDWQQAGDFLELDLGHAASACSVRISVGSHAGSYPRSLAVLTSMDGVAWETSSSGRMARAAIAAAVDRPRAATIELPLGSTPTRFVRLRLEADQPKAPWLVTEVAVTTR
jgi:hypothetical protein